MRDGRRAVDVRTWSSGEQRGGGLLCSVSRRRKREMKKAENSHGHSKMQMGFESSGLPRQFLLRWRADCRERLGPGGGGVEETAWDPLDSAGVEVGVGVVQASGWLARSLARCKWSQLGCKQRSARLEPPRGISKVPGHPIQNCRSAVPRRLLSLFSPHRAVKMLNLRI